MCCKARLPGSPSREAGLAIHRKSVPVDTLDLASNKGTLVPVVDMGGGHGETHRGGGKAHGCETRSINVSGKATG